MPAHSQKTPASAPRLTDRRALVRQRQRAVRSQKPAMFLHEEAACEIQERLALVKRRFTRPAIVTGFPDFWRDRLEGARIVADDDVLDLAPGAHDLVVHAMALHWADDPVGQLVQARRALAPDGLMLAAAFGEQTLHELRSALATAESEICGGLSPRVAPMAEIRDLGGLMQRAGFALPVADKLTTVVTYPSLRALMHDLRAMGEANALHHRLRRPTRRSVFDRAGELYRAVHPAENGISATFDTVYLTGWAPDDSQPQPLRPGSASARLADALGTEEIGLHDPARPDRV